MKIYINSNEQCRHKEPHIHIKYQDFEVSFSILTGKLIVGELSGKKQRLIKNWMFENSG